MSKPSPLSGAVDVAVVGGGVMGCAVGLRLAQAGLRVTVVERGIPGAEASSAAAGILGPQWESDSPGPLIDLGLRSRALYPDFAVELRALSGIDIGYRAAGLIELALCESDWDALERRRCWQRAAGLRVDLLSPGELRVLEPHVGPQVAGGLLFVDEAHVSARLLARALSQAAASAGVTFLQGRYVKRVLIEAGRAVGVQLDGESLHADRVVIAAGSWSSLVEGGSVAPGVVRPARGQMVAIDMRPPLFRHVLAPHARGYLVPRADGVALVGSTLEMVGYNKEVTVAGLASILTLAQTILPVLGERPVVETWANFRPYTPDQLPVLGATHVAGLVLATGHHRYGILLTPMTAQVIADLVLERPLSVDLAPFSVERFAQA